MTTTATATSKTTTRPSSFSPLGASRQPRRIVSSSQISPPIRQRTSPQQWSHNPHTFIPLPLYLHAPQPPQSKFSASTGDSRRHSAEEDRRGKKLKEREGESIPMNEHANENREPVRGRKLSQASFRNLIRTPSRVSLKKKGSLVNLLGLATNKNKEKDEREKEKEQSARDKAADFKARIDGPNHSPSASSSHQTKKTPRTKSIRTAIKDLAEAAKAQLSGSSSGSVSGYGTASESGASSTKRNSSSVASEKSQKKRWASQFRGIMVTGGGGGRRGRVEKEREMLLEREEEQTPPMPMAETALAEKVLIPRREATPMPPRPARLPSRIPITAVFPGVMPQKNRPDHPRPAQSQLMIPQEHTNPPPRSTSLAVPNATVDTRAATISTAGHHAPAPLLMTSGNFRTLANFRRPSPPPPLTLLPSATIRPNSTSSSFLRPPSQATDSGESTSSNEQCHTPPTPSPSRASFRSPSPARFRDLIPSPPASSSPEKNEMNLPMPSEGSPLSLREKGVRKKGALGPEQLIVMEHSGGRMEAEGAGCGILNVCGATTDLADLLSALDDTANLSTEVTLNPIPDVPELPTINTRRYSTSGDSVVSNTSDVPDDLLQLINAVSDHISEVEINLDDDTDTCDVVPDTHHVAPRPVVEAAQDFTDEITNYYGGGGSTGLVSSEGTTTAFGSNGSDTVSSFEGHVSTAAMALRKMLEGPQTAEFEMRYTRPGSDDEHARPSRSGRESLRDYLEMERPSVGEKMLDQLDIEVSLSSLMGAESPPPSPFPESLARAIQPAQPHRLQHSRINSTGSTFSTGSSLGSITSPTPANGIRQSLVRYSQDPNRFQPIFPAKRPMSLQSTYSSESDVDRPGSPPPDLTTISTKSTNLSISSVNSSPCPNPAQRRIPMLTRGSQPPVTACRFPPASQRAITKANPWVSAKPEEIQPVKEKAAIDASPFKKKFNPLEQFKAKKTGGVKELAAKFEQKAATSGPPAFVRPLRLASKAGPARPLSQIVPPDTPPPSSPSASARSNRSGSQSSITSVLEIDVQSSLLPRGPTGTIRPKGHSRTVSVLPTILHEPIVEEESPSKKKPEVEPIEVILDEMLVDRKMRIEADSTVEITAPIGSIDVEIGCGSDDEGLDMNIMRVWLHFNHEAEMEIKRSRARWPDTEASIEAMRSWTAPMTTYDILTFLFDSQNRFRSAFPDPIFACLGLPDPEITPSEAPSPPSFTVSPDASYSTEESSHVSNISIFPPSPAKIVRIPLGSKPINHQVALTKSTSVPQKTEDSLSPFTALPPKLGLKLRRIRPSVSPAKKKVDVSFLGTTASQRRKDQFDAARRKLEGVGRAEEQRSDGESDSEGLTQELTFEDVGDGTAFVEFVKTPKLPTRPQVKRKVALSNLR